MSQKRRTLGDRNRASIALDPTPELETSVDQKHRITASAAPRPAAVARKTGGAAATARLGIYLTPEEFDAANGGPDAGRDHRRPEGWTVALRQCMVRRGHRGRLRPGQRPERRHPAHPSATPTEPARPVSRQTALAALTTSTGQDTSHDA